LTEHSRDLSRILKISIPESLLFNMIRKAIENSGHDLLINIARDIGCPLDTLKGKQPFRYWAFLKLCRLTGFNENEILPKCDVTWKVPRRKVWNTFA